MTDKDLEFRILLAFSVYGWDVKEDQGCLVIIQNLWCDTQFVGTGLNM